MGTNFASYLAQKAKEWIKNDPPKEGDYEENGILHCGKCKTPKRVYQTIGATTFLTTTECKCSKEARETKEKEATIKEREERLLHSKRSSGMEDRYLHSSFETIEEDEENKVQIKSCKRYVSDFENMVKETQGLLLFGPCGTGKTLLACCICDALMRKGKEVLIIKTSEFVGMSYNFDEKIANLLERVKRVDLLVLDDYGTESDSDYSLQTVDNLVSTRYGTNKPFIVTTNFTPTKMLEETNIRRVRLSERIMENNFPVAFTGKSRRLQGAAKRFEAMKKKLGENS